MSKMTELSRNPDYLTPGEEKLLKRLLTTKSLMVHGQTVAMAQGLAKRKLCCVRKAPRTRSEAPYRVFATARGCAIIHRRDTPNS